MLNAFDFNAKYHIKTTKEDGTRTAYTYYPKNLRFSKQTTKGSSVSYTGFLWDGSQTTAELDKNMNVTQLYTLGRNNRRIMGKNTYTNAIAFYMYNPHGDVQGLINTSGALTKTYEYDAFGNEIDMDSTDTNPWRYCGEYYDTETEDIYLRNRYYNPSIGRFTTEDTNWNVKNMVYGDSWDKKEPKVDISAIRQSSNLYLYCINNPVYYDDNTGKLVIVIGEQAAVQFGFKLSVSGAVCFDSKLNFGVVDTVSVASGMDAGIIVGKSILIIPGLDNIEDLNGSSVEIGGSAQIKQFSLGFDSSSVMHDGKVVSGIMVSISVGGKCAPFETHAQYSFSKVEKGNDLAFVQGNYGVIARKVYSAIKEVIKAMKGEIDKE